MILMNNTDLMHRVWILAGLSVCLIAASTDEIPLPKDVKQPTPPYEAMIGSQRVTMQAFRTKLPVDELRNFYTRALADKGWRVEALPWQTSLEQRVTTLTEVQEKVPNWLDYANDPRAKEYLSPENIQQMQDTAQRAIHAVRGDEHVLLNLYPGEELTGVYVKRWRGTLVNPSAGGPDAGQQPSASSWPATNTCCSGDSVPADSRKLPPSIPDFPRARMIAVTSEPGTSSITSALYLSDAPVQEVLDFYRARMAYNGWELINSTQDIASTLGQAFSSDRAFNAAKDLTGGQLSFKYNNEFCGVAVAESLGPQGTSNGSSEKTVVSIIYMEQPATRTGVGDGIPVRRP